MSEVRNLDSLSWQESLEVDEGAQPLVTLFSVPTVCVCVRVCVCVCVGDVRRYNHLAAA